MLVTAHKGLKMIKAFFARMFPPHQWVETEGRRTCSVCQRVEELNEVLGVSWDTIAKGDASKHVPARSLLDAAVKA